MRVEHLNYRHHKNGPLFFKDLNFHLDPGKLHALHGKNGTGKTVLLNILSGKQASASFLEGNVAADGNVVLVNQRFDRMIADQFSFNDNLRFARLNRFPAFFSGLKPSDSYEDFLKCFHIDAALPVNHLSGGQRQILALLMVLQRNVDVLLLDEPTATLDEHNAVIVFEFLKILTAQNVTVLAVCHDKELIEKYATGQHLCLETDEQGMRKLKILKS